MKQHTLIFLLIWTFLLCSCAGGTRGTGVRYNRGLGLPSIEHEDNFPSSGTRDEQETRSNKNKRRQ